MAPSAQSERLFQIASGLLTVFLLVFLLLVLGGVFGGTDSTVAGTVLVDNPEVAGKASSLNFGSLVQKTLLSLVVIGALAWAVIVVLKKISASGASGKVQYMTEVERLHLGRDAAVSVIRIGPRALIVGQSGQGVETLAEYSEEEWAQIVEYQKAQITDKEEGSDLLKPSPLHSEVLDNYLSILPGWGQKT